MMFPPFSKNDAPDSAHQAIDGGKVTQKEPRASSKYSGEEKKRKIRLSESEVEGNLRISRSAFASEINGTAYLLP